MKFYYEIVLKDGSTIEIPPDAVDVVRKRWDQGLPIHTKTQGSIAPTQIAAVRPTGKRADSPPLLEEVAQVFNEPVMNGDGSIVARWVKKLVTSREWEKLSSIPAYKNLGSENGMVMVAFRLPVHQIDTRELQYCSNEEVKKLET